MALFEINFITLADCYVRVEAENFDEALDSFYKGVYDDYEVITQDVDSESVVVTKIEGF